LSQIDSASLILGLRIHGSLGGVFFLAHPLPHLV
jgi:hypothetical protein